MRNTYQLNLPHRPAHACSTDGRLAPGPAAGEIILGGRESHLQQLIMHHPSGRDGRSAPRRAPDKCARSPTGPASHY